MVEEEGFLCCGSDAGRTVKEGRVDRAIALTTQHIGEFYHTRKMGLMLENNLLKTIKVYKAAITETLAYIFSAMECLSSYFVRG